MPDLAATLIQLTVTVERAFAEGCRANGLTSRQGHLLCRLVNGPSGMSELGRTLELEKSSLTGLVDRVEKRGLVTRRREPHDRRSCEVVLTTKGERVAHATHAEVTTRLENLAAHLHDTDRARLETLLTAITSPETITAA